MKPVFALIVTYRRFAEFKATLESLVHTLPNGSEILIVDNHSDTGEYGRYWWELGETKPFDKLGKELTLKILLLEKNVGWGAAMNDGLRTHGEWKNFEYFLESNNDVTYESDWCIKAQAMMEAHAEIGILGLCKHPHHGVRQELPDGLVIKDNMPATAWLFRSKDLETFGPFKERGVCNTRGGNGEDTEMVLTAQAQNRWVCGMREDLATHMDGYDIPDLGKPNPAYD